MLRQSSALALIAMLAACGPPKPFEVLDGERVKVRGHLLRLHGVDAPDRANPACPAEAEAAARIEARLRQLLSEAKQIDFMKTGMACLQWDTCDAFVRTDGVDVSDTLIAEGFAARRVVEGGGIPPRDWCASALTPGAIPAP